MFPRMVTLKRLFPREGLQNIEAAVKGAIDEAGIAGQVSPGQRVGITAGSRGINNIVFILREVCAAVRRAGAEPLILAAMGSHGGGSEDGQRAILCDLGITPDSMGAPILTSANSVPVAKLDDGMPVLVSHAATTCDAIIVVNRIKPHTSFHGPAESGLQKMVAVGLGGPAGAMALHSRGALELSRLIPAAAAKIMEKLPVIAGLAILEDAYDETKGIAGVSPAEFAEIETRMLAEAKRTLPTLPAKELDLLVVESMGKIYSGTGMDTNVIGRLRINGLPEPESPSIKRIVVLDLAPGSGGNGNGIGLADFTTWRLVDKINFDTTYRNVLTSTFVQRAMIPITLGTDKQAVSIALRSLGAVDRQAARVIRIHNTLHLESIQVSESLLPELAGRDDIEITGAPEEMAFDPEENLLPF